MEGTKRKIPVLYCVIQTVLIGPLLLSSKRIRESIHGQLEEIRKYHAPQDSKTHRSGDKISPAAHFYPIYNLGFNNKKTAKPGEKPYTWGLTNNPVGG